MQINKPNWISLAALLVLVVSVPVYGYMETGRMARAKQQLRQEYVRDAVDIYLQNCANCHGAAGEGIGTMPALNRPALAEAQADLLFQSIARTKHGTAMAAWHVDEGGILTDYQVKKMVALIQEPDWSMVAVAANERGYVEPQAPADEIGLSYLNTEDAEDPHQCIDCHEDPAIHANLFGINCGRCHNTVTWKPAVLTRHDFLLDHGGQGDVDCKTCHPTNYMTYDCYGCHEDHQPAEMEIAHLAEEIYEYTDCARCHPTGASGEAEPYRKQSTGLHSILPGATEEVVKPPVDPGQLDLSLNH